MKPKNEDKFITFAITKNIHSSQKHQEKLYFNNLCFKSQSNNNYLNS